MLQSEEAVSGQGWSDGFDCMASHCCQLRLQLHAAGECTVAVSVHKVGLQWQVLLQPSFVLLNKTAAVVHVHYTGQLLASKGRRSEVSANAPRQREALQQASGAGFSFALEPESKVGRFDGTQTSVE